MRSLRKTLILGTTLGTAGTLVTAGVLLYVLVRASLWAEFDRSLLDKAQILASAVQQERGQLDLGFDDLDLREFQGDDPTAYLQLWLADASTLYQSSDGKLKRPDRRQNVPSFERIRLPDGRNGRSVTFAFAPHAETADGQATESPRQGNPQSSPAMQTIDLVLARSTEPIDQALMHLGVLLLWVGLAAVAASTGVLWWVVRRATRPLERLAGDIAALAEDDLTRRIDLDANPLEIQPVVDRLNDLLRRLETAFRRERAFSANVAHELRNPLAGLRLKLDVAMSKTRHPGEYHRAMDECRQITGQMQTMVENLLSLARLEAGQVQVRCESLLLDQLIRELWQPFDAHARHRLLNVQWSLQDKIPLVSDVSLLRVLVRNVLENAVAYADQGGTVRIGARSTDHLVEFSASNSGSRLTQVQAENAFEQFWRGDEARSEAGIHCGLGLPLVRKIATVLGGTAVARSTADGCFDISVSIPSWTDESQSHLVATTAASVPQPGQ
jgi:signal transduction histidine kinase